MPASTEDIAAVRRRTAEPAVDGDYSDALLAEMIEAHPIAFNDDGEAIAFDIWLTAADVWAEKASALAGGFDFGADGASFNRSQAYEQAKKQAAFCASRAAAKGVVF